MLVVANIFSIPVLTLYYFKDQKQVPLTGNQKMIALHQHRYPSSSIYNITDIIKVTAKVDKTKIIDAFHTFMITHPAATMTVGLDFQCATLGSSKQNRTMAAKGIVMHAPTKEEDIASVTTANTKIPFNIFEPSALIRMHIIPISNSTTTIIQGIMHHLAGDGLCGFMLSPRVIQFYSDDDGFYWHYAHSLRQLNTEIMLHHYAHQTSLAESDNPAKRFWISKIAAGEFDTRLDTFTSLPRGSSPTFNGGERVVKLDSTIWESLKNLSTELGCTRFHLLTAAWSIIICRYFQQSKFNLGAAFHCRKEEWLDSPIFTSNAMPVRIEIEREFTFKQLVSAIKKSIDVCKKNEEYPASSLIKDIISANKIATPQGQNPLFQSEVNYYHIPQLPKLATKDIMMNERIYPQFMQAGMTDLTAWFVTMNNGVVLNIKYNTDIYKQELIQLIESDLLKLLSLLLKTSIDTSVNEIVRLSAKSIEKFCRGPFRKGMTVIQRILARKLI